MEYMLFAHIENHDFPAGLENRNRCKSKKKYGSWNIRRDPKCVLKLSIMILVDILSYLKAFLYLGLDVRTYIRI